jgi:homoserine kinase
MRARAPASSANLGPGFDVLAVALSLYVEVSVEPADELTVSASGQGADLPSGREHLAARVAAQVVGHDRLAVTVHSDIPVGRGLGSSAALAVAAAAAAGAEAPFPVAAAVDGHPENAAASAFGGLVAAATVRGQPVARRLALDPRLAFVVLVPDRTLLTKEARAALPHRVDHADAAFNLGRMGLLVAGLADRGQLIAEACDDRLHQNARSSLFPEAAGLLAGLRDAGAITSCWSGAGPSLLAVCDRDSADDVRNAAEALMSSGNITGRALRLEADLGGITVYGGTGG